MDVVCFGQQNWDVCWTAKQHLMTRLARRGHRILYVDPVPSHATKGLGGTARALFPPATGFGLREVERGLWVYTDPYCKPLGEWLNGRRGHAVMRGLVRRLHLLSPVALVLTPYKRWLKEGVRPAARVYYAVDEWTAFGGLEHQREWIRREEEALLREADVALAVSPRLFERFRQVQPNTRLLENAADVEHFSPARLSVATPHPLLASLSHPIVGFVGQVDERIDQDLLLHLARARPGWQIVLAGRVKDGVDVSALAAAPNIRLLGYVPYADLPRVVREFDACIVPYRLTELTRSCSPLKTYEYLATGKPVVATPLDGLGVCRDVVSLAATPDDFLHALDAALADPNAGRQRRLDVAAANTWDDRADALEQHLDEALYLAASRGSAKPGRNLLPARFASKIDVRLDPKDESERQLRDDFRDVRLSAPQRAFYYATRAAGWTYYALRCAARLARGRRPFEVEKILVVRRAYLGDLVAFLPTLAALRRRYPQAKIVLGGQPNMTAAELLQGSTDVDEVRVLDFMSHADRLQRLRGAWGLFREGFDVLICGVSYFLIREAFYCGAPKVISLYDGHPFQRLGSGVVPLDPNRHESDNNLALAEALDCTARGVERVPRLVLPQATLEQAASRVAPRLALPSDATLITIHPGSKRPSRRWPTERFTALIRGVLETRPSAHVVLTGVPDEQPLVDSILTALPTELRARAHSGIGLTDLPSLVALLDRSAAVVCNDTGVMHLARARGRPLLALLGPENDRRWGPHALGAAPAIALRHVVPCAPCVRWTCDEHYCMNRLTVDEAADALDRLLDGGSDGITPGESVVGRALPLVRLERRARRHGWPDLAAAGFPLPAATVIVACDAAEAASRSIGGQDYPNLQVVALVRDITGISHPADFVPPPSGLTDVTVVHTSAPAEQAWHDGLRAARGEFVTLLRAGETLPAGGVGGNVVALFRTPAAAAADGSRVYSRDAVAAWGEPRAGVTYRRDALEALVGPPAITGERSVAGGV